MCGLPRSMAPCLCYHLGPHINKNNFSAPIPCDPPSSLQPWLLPVQGCVTAPSSFQRQIHARTHACRSMSGCLGASVVLTVALTAGQALLGCLLGALPAPRPATPLCPRDDNTLVSASPRVSQITRCKRPYLCPSSPAVP